VPEAQARALLAEVVLALLYLHGERRQPLGALSADHVVLDERGTVRLVGLGLRSQVLCGGPHGADARAGPWAAPELLRGQPASRAADVWGVGALLWTLLAGRPPRDGGG
jgi:serine/threonine protein kinase